MQEQQAATTPSPAWPAEIRDELEAVAKAFASLSKTVARILDRALPVKATEGEAPRTPGANIQPRYFPAMTRLRPLRLAIARIEKAVDELDRLL
jgi:hypothetical protein